MHTFAITGAASGIGAVTSARLAVHGTEKLGVNTEVVATGSIR